MDPHGSLKPLDTKLEGVGNTLMASYTPKSAGPHLLNLLLGGEHVPGSPAQMAVVDVEPGFYFLN
jgi:hypothetical protein